MSRKSEIIKKLRDLAFMKRKEAEKLDDMATMLHHAYPWASDEELHEAEKLIQEAEEE